MGDAPATGRDRLTRRRVAGGLVGLAGVGLVVAQDHTDLRLVLSGGRVDVSPTLVAVLVVAYGVFVVAAVGVVAALVPGADARRGRRLMTVAAVVILLAWAASLGWQVLYVRWSPVTALGHLVGYWPPGGWRADTVQGFAAQTLVVGAAALLRPGRRTTAPS